MGDGNSETMNLDLNLGPISSPDNETITESLMNENVNLEDYLEGHRPTLLRQNARSRMRQRWRSLLSPAPVPFEARSIASEFIVNTTNRDFLQTGEGSASLEERNDDVAKDCKNEATLVDNDDKFGKNEEKEKESGEEGSFFECNICLDISSDPVLTCCGHLFCWPCLYQWLNVHSDAKECPVCKGEVTTKNLTPIYGRGSNNQEQNTKTSLKIPDRPQARRVESWRQTIQRNAFTIPMDEMIRRLGSGSDFSRDFVDVQPQSVESLNESPERNSSLLNRILTSRGMRQEQTTTTTAPPEDNIVDVDVTQNNNRVGTEVSYLRRSNTYRSVPTVELMNITQRLMESYMRYSTGERGQEQLLPVDDRDSVSSIAAVIHSESQTLDTAVEIDSTVSLSTSSSRRRVDASRVSDVDSGDSRAPRRRRLN